MSKFSPENSPNFELFQFNARKINRYTEFSIGMVHLHLFGQELFISDRLSGIFFNMLE